MLSDTAPAPTIDVGLYSFPGGRQSICVFVKRTYELVHGRPMARSGRGEIPLIPEPIEDDADGSQPVSCLLHESDMAPRKPCTDIVVHGHVRAPSAVPTSSMLAAVRVGALHKRVHVVGDRRIHWRPGCRLAFDRPEPFVALPLTWGRAFGGIDGSLDRPEPADIGELLRAFAPEEHPGAYPRNPAGTGWVVNADERSLSGMLLPNLEDPDYLLTVDRLVYGDRERWPLAPIPAGFGWLSQTWFPRSTFLGIGPDLPSMLRGGWLEHPPELEEGPDPRFFSGASRGMRGVGLQGDEPLELHGFYHEGKLTTALPGDRPDILVAFDRRPLETALRLHTIELFADHHMASLLWVAEAEPPRQLPVRLPGEDIDDYDVLEGVDVLIDGVAMPRGMLG